MSPSRHDEWRDLTMPAIKGVIRNGQVILAGAANWPDGTEVTVQLPDRAGDPTAAADEGPMTPEEIAQTLAAMDKVEPFEMTDAERADIAAWRQKVKEYSVANMGKGIEGL